MERKVLTVECQPSNGEEMMETKNYHLSTIIKVDGSMVDGWRFDDQ